MKLIFERSMPGRGQDIFPECDVEIKLPHAALREKEAALPEISENEMGRHYTELAKASRGVNDGFYPLGSCTMKHNPRRWPHCLDLPTSIRCSRSGPYTVRARRWKCWNTIWAKSPEWTASLCSRLPAHRVNSPDFS